MMTPHHSRYAGLAGCLVAAGLLLGAAPRAEAQDIKLKAEDTYSVAVLNVLAEGADPKLAAQITTVLKTETKRNPRAQIVKQEDIALLDSLLLLGCEEPTPPCMGQLADYLQARRLVYGRLITVDDLYDIEVNVFDNAEGKVVKTWNKRFTANADAIGFFVKEMEEFLGERQRPKPTRLRVTANIADAYIVLDGKRVGRAPYFSDELTPGPHKVEVTREGYQPWVYDLNAVEGSEAILRANLERAGGGQTAQVTPPIGPVRPPISAEPPGGGPPLIQAEDGVPLATWGWVSLGAGLVTASVGGIFGVFALNTESDLKDTTLQREAYELRDQGESEARTANILYGVGAVLGLTGLVLVLVDDSAPAQPATSVSVGPMDSAGSWGVSVASPF